MQLEGLEEVAAKTTELAVAGVKDMLRLASLRRRASSGAVGVWNGRRMTSTYKFRLLGESVGISYEKTCGLRQLTEWSMRVQIIKDKLATSPFSER